MAERASAKRVTGDEPQGTMGRLRTSPSRLPLRAHFNQKRDVWVRGRLTEGKLKTNIFYKKIISSLNDFVLHIPMHITKLVFSKIPAFWCFAISKANIRNISRKLAGIRCCSLNLFSMFRHQLRYVVLGPRVKVINLNILPESSCNELKYSLKIAFMFLSIILKFQVPDINILLGIRKKATVCDGPWSANLVVGPRLRQAAR